MAEYVQSLTQKIVRSTSKSDSENDRRAKREIANNNERRRMKYINMGFMQLRQLLIPNGTEGEKMSKATILSHAHERIRQLELQNSVFRQELEKRRHCSSCGQTVVSADSQDIQPIHLATYPTGAIKLQYSGSIKRPFPKSLDGVQAFSNPVVYKIPNDNQLVRKDSPLSSPTQVETNTSSVSYLIHAAKQLNQDDTRPINNSLQMQLTSGAPSLVICQSKPTQRPAVRTLQLKTHMDHSNQMKKETALVYDDDIPYLEKRPRVLPPKMQHKSQYKNDSIVALQL